MRTLVWALLLCSLILVAGCYPSGVGKDVRSCKDSGVVIEQQVCLSQLAYDITEEHPRAAKRICEKEVAGLIEGDKPIEDIAGQIMVNGCLQVVADGQ